jgi:hypothetical protein
MRSSGRQLKTPVAKAAGVSEILSGIAYVPTVQEPIYSIISGVRLSM